MSSLQGKVAVVLGASAEAGTGWAIAEGLAEAGAKVVVGARSEAPLKKLAAKIGGVAVTCDACREDDIQNLAKVAIERFGKLDIAVNSAGGAAAQGLVSQMTDAVMQAALQLNYFAHVYFVKHMAAAMTGEGSIIIVSSLSTTHPIIPTLPYAAAKSATDCLVRYAAMEFGPRGIRVNSILPGPIMSDAAKGFLDVPEIARVFEKEVPLRRLGLPRDFANAAVWLAGPAYITGANIPVCGGSQLARFPYLSELPGAGNAWEGQGQSLFDKQQAS